MLSFILKILNVFTIITIFFFLRFNYHLKKQQQDFQSFNNEKVIDINTKKILSEEEQINYRLFPSKKWTFNFNISQYSSFAYTYNDINYFESFVMFNHELLFDKGYHTNNLKCLILNNKNKRYIQVPLDDIMLIAVEKLNSSIWNVKCSLPYLDDINYLSLAVVDYSYFDYYFSKFNKKFNYLLLTFQQPVKIDRSLPKLKQIVHCLHCVEVNNDATLNRLLNWIEMQRILGLQKLKMYLYNTPIKYEKRLRKINKMRDFFVGIDDPFLDIVVYDISLETVCYWIRKEKLNNKNHDKVKIYQYLYENCLSAYKKHFDMTYSIWGKIQNHKIIHSNDCFATFKYRYEYYANFDFDEIIFPRTTERNEICLPKSSNIIDKCGVDTNGKKHLISNSSYDPTKTNLYDYVNNLVEKFDLRNNYASVYFQPFIFLNNHKKLTDILSKYEITKKLDKIEFGMNKVRSLNYSIRNNTKDRILLEKFKLFPAQIDCLNKSFNRIDSRFDRIWNNPYSVMNKRQKGKSIFITENTNTLDLHIAHSTLNNARLKFDVPTHIGYTGHFRNDLYKFYKYKKNYVFLDFTLDYEYYLFFLNISNSNNKFNFND